MKHVHNESGAFRKFSACVPDKISITSIVCPFMMDLIIRTQLVEQSLLIIGKTDDVVTDCQIPW